MPCCWPATLIAATSCRARRATTTRVPPRVRILLAARRRRRRVRTVAAAHELAAVGVAHLELARLGRGVDPGDERHASTASVDIPASNARSTAPATAASPSMPLATTGTCSASSASWARRAAERFEQELEGLGGLAAHHHELAG